MSKVENIEFEHKLLIFSYLSSQASKEETLVLLEWLKKSDDNQKIFSDYRKLYDLTQNTDYKIKFSETRQDNWKRLNDKIEKETSPQKIRKLPFYLKIAAAGLLIFFAGALTFYGLFGSKSNQNLCNIEYEVNAPRGGKSELVLADGTKVWLNAGTRLRYRGDYGITSRVVYLTGEGFFSVVKNPRKPFVVQTSGLKIKAFGTTFNVKAYPEEKSVTTTLVEGIVKIEGNGVNLSLKPKEVVIVDKDASQNIIHTNSKTEITSIKPNTYRQIDKIENPTINVAPIIKVASNVNTSVYTSWKDNLWIINSEPLKNIAVILERRFNVTIDIRSSELNQYTFTGTFNNETLEQILGIIKLTAPLNYQINKGVITITSEQKRKATYNKLIK
jgi:transmembrane sensor